MAGSDFVVSPVVSPSESNFQAAARGFPPRRIAKLTGSTHAWRAYAIAERASGQTSIIPIALNGASAGSVDVSGFGSRIVK